MSPYRVEFVGECSYCGADCDEECESCEHTVCDRHVAEVKHDGEKPWSEYLCPACVKKEGKEALVVGRR